MLQRTRFALKHYDELLDGGPPCGIYAISFLDCRKMYIGSSAISRATKGVSKPTRGKTFMQIYGTDSPTCGFQKGDKNISKRSEVRKKISAAITEWHKRRHGK